jgi:hypothetical protein
MPQIFLEDILCIIYFTSPRDGLLPSNFRLQPSFHPLKYLEEKSRYSWTSSIATIGTFGEGRTNEKV